VMPYEVTTEKVVCLCVHGTCNEGEAECSGGCKSGYTGLYCDVPTSNEVLQAVVKPKKDHSGDGLYKPQQISDQALTSSESRRHSDSDSSQGTSDHTKAIKISGEV